LKAHFAVIRLEIRDTKSFLEMLAEVSKTEMVDLDFFIQACLKVKGTATVWTCRAPLTT